MNDPRDLELDRVLKEYQEDLRAQAPSPALLGRLREEARQAQAAKTARVVPISRHWRHWKLSGLAVAASLLLAFGVYQAQKPTMPGLEQAVQLTPEPLQVAEPVPSVGGDASANKAPASPVTAPPAAPAVDPSAPPSIRAALAPQAPAAPQELAHQPPARQQPAGRSESTKAETTAADAADVRKEAKAVGLNEAESARGSANPVNATALTATVFREVWEPGQLTRVFTGSYQRSAEGTEVRSPLTPSEIVAQSQVSMPAPAAPSQMAMPETLERRRGLTPVRDQIAAARAKVASPQVTSLGTSLIEGFRCTGTRTVDGQRVIERWHSTELGLDLLVRTTEANGSTVIVRYANIERRP